MPHISLTEAQKMGEDILQAHNVLGSENAPIDHRLAPAGRNGRPAFARIFAHSLLCITGGGRQG